MRRTPKSLFLYAALVLCSTCPSQGVVKAGWHEDTKNGFKIKLPEKWSAVPTAIDEKWIVAKYIGDRSLAVKKGDYPGMELRAQMRVIVFSDEARKVKPAEAKVVEKEEDKVITQEKRAEVPYRDYKDYLKRNSQDGGYFFTKENETKVADAPVWQYEIKFEKMTVPRRVVAWVFRGDAADYAVEYEVLEDHFEKHLPIFTGSLQSFRFIKRDSEAVGSGGSSTGGSSGGDIAEIITWKKREAWKALTAKERSDRRKTIEVVRLQRVKDSLPSGWTIKNTPHFMVVSHTEQRYTDKIVEAAEACRTWLDKVVGPVNDEYVMRSVIRVCASFDEWRLFHSSSTDAWNPMQREIVTYKDADMGKRSGFDMMFSSLCNSYLFDKDPVLQIFAPEWITTGLIGVLQAAKPEGKTLKLGSDAWEDDILRDWVRSGKKIGARQLMEMPPEEFYTNYMNRVFAARLVRLFLSTKKDFVLEYLKASLAAGEELIKGNDPKVKEAKTEEEEEARMKQFREEGKKRFGEMVQKVHAQVCNWSDKEWQSLDAAFAATLK